MNLKILWQDWEQGYFRAAYCSAGTGR